MEECSCCCAKFTKLLRRPIVCPNNECGFATCKDCLKNYLSTRADTKCMNCGIYLSKQHLAKEIGKKWVNKGLYIEQAKALLVQQKARFCEDSALAAHKKKWNELCEIENNWKKELKELYIKNEKIIANCVKSDKQKKEKAQKLLELAKNMQTIRLKIQEARDVKDYYRESEGHKHLQNTDFNYIIQCPINRCRGFANELSTCNMCKTKICKECHEEDKLDHECNQQTLETLKLLIKDTKNCPCCKTLINKIEGCDQMWCPQCKTAFSWNTGVIETGLIHNPHYYAWRKENNEQTRNVGDVACGGLINNEQLIEFISSVIIKNINNKKTIRQIEIIVGFHSLINSFQRDLDYQKQIVFDSDNNLRKYRIDFLIGNIVDDKQYIEKYLITHLQKQSNAHELIPILEMATTCLTERVNLVINNLNNNVSHYLDENNKLIEDILMITGYVCDELNKISDSVPNKLSNNGSIILNSLNKVKEEINNNDEYNNNIDYTSYSWQDAYNSKIRTLLTL